MKCYRLFYHSRYLLLLLLLLTALGPWGLRVSSARAATQIDVGYQDYQFNAGCNSTPTGEKPESKLWFNDGLWWGSLCDDATATYHIHRFNWAMQDWEDTGVLLDSRGGSKADVLWDGVAQKLYVVSHIFADNSGAATGSSSQWGKLFRYSYDPPSKTYTLDAGFPANVTRGTSETLTVAKDSTGKLWVTYAEGKKVMVNHSTTDDATWGTPFALPVTGASALDSDDISAVVSHAGKIAVMWSNQKTKIMYLAFHDDSEANDQLWSSISVYNPSGAAADDHMNLKSLQSDGGERLFAVTKTSYSTSSQPLINLLACTAAPCTNVANWQAHLVYTSAQDNTRPILLIDPEHQKLHIFSTDRGTGNGIHHKVSDINNIQFANATDEPFIKSADDVKINNATSTKQHVNSGTGILVAASSQTTYHYYHNCLSLTGTGSGCEISNLPVTVAFASVAYNVNENAGNATITVNLNRSPAADVTVNYATSDGTATAGSDYTAQNGTLTFPAGTISKSFIIPIVSDSFAEANETINLTLSAANGADLTAPTEAVLTISDDDPLPAVQFDQASFSVDENTASGKAIATVLLSAASPVTVTVRYTASNGTATSGSDYTATLGILNFSPNQTSQSLELPIINDNLNEGDETVKLSLGSPTEATLGAVATAVLTIVDEDPKPTVQFAAANTNSNENDSTATISITLSAPSALPITVQYATSNGSATAGTDYKSASGPLNFAAGETVKTFTVALTDDLLDEPNETINLTLANPTNANLGTPNPATLTLLDDDGAATVRFSAAQVNVSESAAQANVTVNLVGTVPTTVTVNYATADGTATAGNDYTAQSGILRFAPGAASATINIPLKNDGVDEDDESIRIKLTNASNAILGEPASAILLITDNDNPPLVQFTQANFDVAENLAGGQAPVNVSLSLAAGRPISVSYTTDAGTATKGSDFTAVSDLVVIPAGQTNATFFVPLHDDNNDEVDETVNLTLVGAVNANLGAVSNSILTILDDDSPMDGVMVQWASATYQVNEAAGTVALSAQLNAPATSLLTVAYTVNAATATAGADYTDADGVLAFAAGETSKSVTITVIDDQLDEAEETFTVALQASVPVALGLNATATVTLQDNDAQPTLEVNGNQLWVEPGTAEAKLPLRLSSPSGQVVSIDYTINNGAVTGAGAQPSGTVTFNPGEMSKFITIPLAGNDEGITLTLNNPKNVQLGAVETIMIVVANGRAYLPIALAPEAP